MSKIVVDQIQKSGGPVLSLPPSTAPAPVEGDFLAVDADGNLTFAQPDFSPIAAAVLTVNEIAATLKPGTQYTNHENTAYSSSVIPSTLPINLVSTDAFLDGATTTIRVNDGTTYYCGGAAGASCNWTVPAGVTQAQFQVWGSGAPGASQLQCCTFGSNGGDGAYSFVQMAVSEGEIYCMCSGGACATGIYNGNYACSGCNSFVCSGDSATTILSCGAPAYDSCYIGFNNTIGTQYCVSLNTYISESTQIGFSEAWARTDGGQITTSNDIYLQSQVRARKGPWSGNSCNCCYIHAVSTAHIDCNHIVSRCYGGMVCDLSGVNGCCAYTSDRGPGRGGWGAWHNANCYPCHGAFGNSGEVLLTFK